MQDKVAFISDIHGNYEALKTVVNDIKNKGINMSNVYCLGDLVGYGPRPNETLELLKQHEIISVLGNYDEAVGFYLPNCGCNINSENDKLKTQNSLTWTANHTSEQNKEYLRTLEERLSIEYYGIQILLTHASPYAISEYIFEDNLEIQKEIASEIEEDIIVFGHTHLSYHKWVNGKLFINAGSVGKPKDGDNRACYCILDVPNRLVEFVRVSYDIEKVAKEIISSDLLDVFAEALRQGRDVNTL
ncbi:MAG: hypothetical protein APF77_21700 [Clostridia bacterium BRH_c25]|nr:MAG: hypothetical protein APF77_21700 [Clostridia bacterium BRH_c25]